MGGISLPITHSLRLLLGNGTTRLPPRPLANKDRQQQRYMQVYQDSLPFGIFIATYILTELVQYSPQDIFDNSSKICKNLFHKSLSQWIRLCVRACQTDVNFANLHCEHVLVCTYRRSRKCQLTSRRRCNRGYRQSWHRISA